MNTVRTWNNIEIVPSKSFYSTEFDNYYNYWDIHVDARSYLYKQVSLVDFINGFVYTYPIILVSLY